MGLPLFEFFDETNRVIYPANARYKTLFPESTILSAETQEQIKTQFENRLVCHAYPQYWLGRFHILINREQAKWNKLLESENTLSKDDGKWNYDLYEDGTTKTSSSVNSTMTGETLINDFTSDTPDNEIYDIERYMSAAGRSKNDSSTSANDNGESEGQHTLRRYGNIGVMTSAQIMDGYRDAIRYCAYDDVFKELEPLFIGNFGSVDEDYGYDLRGHEV